MFKTHEILTLIETKGLGPKGIRAILDFSSDNEIYDFDYNTLVNIIQELKKRNNRFNYPKAEDFKRASEKAEYISNISDKNGIKIINCYSDKYPAALSKLSDFPILLHVKGCVSHLERATVAVVGPSSMADCFHIAIATIQKADLLVSWNFKHIVNIERIHGYNAVNLKNGYHTLEIRNPREAFDYEADD